jgi:hypothetical protein
LYAQDFPIPVHPSDSALFNIKKKKICDTGNDTLWIVQDDMFNEMLKVGSKNKLLEEKLKIFIEKEAARDTIIAAYKRDTIIMSDLYHHYLTLWDATDKKLQEQEIKVVKEQQLKWNFGIAGLVLGVVACLVIHNNN